MFGIIFVCLLVSTLLAVACFGILFFYTQSTCSKPAYMIRSIVLLYNFRALCNDRNAHTKKTVLVIRYDWHTFNWTVWILFSKIDKKIYIITVENYLLFGSVYGKVRFFLPNICHFDENLKILQMHIMI